MHTNHALLYAYVKPAPCVAVGTQWTAIRPGELVWRRSESFWHKGQLELLKDGHVVDWLGDEGTRLSNLVAAYPPAVEHARRAEAHLQTSLGRGYWALGLLAVALAGGGAAIVGEYEHNTPVLLGGGAGAMIVFNSVGAAVAFSAANAASDGATDAMDATDLYNDNYVNSQAAR